MNKIKTLSITLVIAVLLIQPVMVSAAKSTVTAKTSVQGNAVLKSIGTVKLTSGNLNIRQGPTTKAKIIGKLPNGSNVEVVEEMKEWAKILVDGKEGFVSKEFLVIKEGLLNSILFKNKIIVLDPGHGGKDPGAIALDGSYESTLNWQYTIKAKAALEKSGYTVYLTRDEKSSCLAGNKQEDHELTCRVILAERVKGDIFISIHADSNPDEKFRGTTVFYNARNDFDGNQNPYSAESRDLAYTIHSYIQPAIGSTDRGMKNQNYFVNRMNTVPSILIELGCLTNWTDLKLLKSKEKQDQFSTSIVNAVDSYFGSSTNLLAAK